MGIVNRRNAILGWAVWKIATNVARSKARRAVPTQSSNGGRGQVVKRAAAVAVGFAAATGAAVYIRKALSEDDAPPVV